MDGSDKFAFSEGIRRGEVMPRDGFHALLIQVGFIILILGTIIQMGLYLMISIKKVIWHSISIKNEVSDIDKVDLVWLRNLLLGLTCIYFFVLGDQFFPNFLGLNILGELVTVMAVILIYAMGYLGLRQPAIFSRVLVFQQTSVDEGADKKEKKIYPVRIGQGY